MFTHVQCCDIVPSLVSSFGESLDIGLYFAPQLPRSFDHFYGAGRGGEAPPPHSAGRGGAPIPVMQSWKDSKCIFFICVHNMRHQMIISTDLTSEIWLHRGNHMVNID